MDLEQIANVGEAVGGIGVLVSLLYLAYQIRDNTRTLKATSKKDISMWWSEWCREMSTNPYGVLHNRSLHPDATYGEFTHDEQTVIGYLCRAVMLRFEAEFSLYESRMLEADVWEEHRLFCRGLLEFPAWAEWWGYEKNQALYSRAFIANIETAAPTPVMGPTPHHKLKMA